MNIRQIIKEEVQKVLENIVPHKKINDLEQKLLKLRSSNRPKTLYGHVDKAIKWERDNLGLDILITSPNGYETKAHGIKVIDDNDWVVYRYNVNTLKVSKTGVRFNNIEKMVNYLNNNM